MKVSIVVERLGQMKSDIRTLKSSLNENKIKFPHLKKKTIINGAVGFALMVSVVAVVTPFVKAQSQRNNTGLDKPIELISIQKETVEFIKLNSIIINYANSTLDEIYSIAPYELTQEQKEMLLAKQYGLMKYKDQISPTDSRFQALSENTVQKISILLSAIDSFLMTPSKHQENMVKLNLYTDEYKKVTDTEQPLLIELLNKTGMSYEVLEDGQIHYSYLTEN